MSIDVSAGYSIAGGEAGRDRLRRLSAVFAPTTGRLLDRVGIRPDARCLDAGCGGGDVSRMLAVRASAGRVIGVDRDSIKVTLGNVGAPRNMELRVEELADTVRSDERFDVLYARFILSHLADPAGWVNALAGLLAPGGVMICEDVRIDGSFCAPPSWGFDRMLAIYCDTVRANGADPNVGPQVPLFLADAGLSGVGVEVIQPAAMSGDAKHLQHLTLALIRDSAVALGMATEAEIDRLALEMAAYADRVDTVISTPQIVQSWGRAR